MSSLRYFLSRSFIAAGLSVCALLLAAQQTDTFSVQVNVVNVLATVRDKQGKIVNNLSKEDFLLEEDGRPQTIKYFNRETDIPLTLGLLVDTSLSQRRVLDEERSASSSFVYQVLREDQDKVFLIHFDHEVELLQDLTSSRRKLDAALQQLTMPSYADRRGGGYPGGGYPGGGGGGYPGGGGRYPRRGGPSRPTGGGTLLHDAVYLASDEMLQKQKGRKAFVILTDGVDQGSKMSLDRAVEAAQRADTVVYCILFSDPDAYGRQGGWGGGPWGGRRGGGWPSPRQPEQADGKKVLRRISQETGGRMFEVSRKLSIDQIYQQIQDELRNQYNLGYTPDRAANGSAYRRIHLKTRQPNLVVQARDGYYSGRPAGSDGTSSQD